MHIGKNAFFGLFTSLLCLFLAKNRSNEINSPKIALTKYFWKVLKNHSNNIHTNEIRIRRESPVYENNALFKQL